MKFVTVSSPKATDATLEDTVSSILAEGAPPEVTVQWLTNTPNSSFEQWMRDVRTCSASPWPRWTISPSKLSVAQRHAQIAEQKAESAFSGVGMVADQTRYAQSVAEAAIAEVRSVRDEVASRMEEVAKRSDVSVSNIADVLTGKVQQVAAQFEAQTSHAVGQVAQQLEREVKPLRRARLRRQNNRLALQWKTFAANHRRNWTKFAQIHSGRRKKPSVKSSKSRRDLKLLLNN